MRSGAKGAPGTQAPIVQIAEEIPFLIDIYLMVFVYL